MSNPKAAPSPENPPHKKGKDFDPDTTNVNKALDPIKPPTAFDRCTSSDTQRKREGGESES